MATDNFTLAGDESYVRSRIGFKGLCESLANPLPGDSEIKWDAYDPQQLLEIANQASNIKETSMMGLEAIGRVFAYAADTGSILPADSKSIGWLVTFLTELTIACDFYEDEAEFFHAEKVKKESKHG